LEGTEYRLLSRLCEALNVKVPFTGLAIGEVFDRFKSAVDSNKLIFVTVLDEIDTLIKKRGDVLLYELTRINESLINSDMSLLGISNDLNFKDLLDPRVLSSLSEEEIVFRPYNASELYDILMDRAQLAFYNDFLSKGVISLCAALAASEHGDARRALDLLRVASELSEREGSKEISEENIRKAERRIEHDRVTEALRSLPLHSKLIILCVYLLGKANISSAITGDIYTIYQEICNQLGLMPLTQRRISGLINELDGIGLLNARLISLGRYGRTKKVRLGVMRSLIKNVFSMDDRLGNLISYIPRCLSEIGHRIKKKRKNLL
jgi:cell division control protein 6